MQAESFRRRAVRRASCFSSTPPRSPLLPPLLLLPADSAPRGPPDQLRQGRRRATLVAPVTPTGQGTCSAPPGGGRASFGIERRKLGQSALVCVSLDTREAGSPSRG